jgi:hypothetical protein
MYEFLIFFENLWIPIIQIKEAFFFLIIATVLIKFNRHLSSYAATITNPCTKPESTRPARKHKHIVSLIIFVNGQIETALR